MASENLRLKVQEFLQAKGQDGEKISQAAFAKAVGIADSTFSRWYSGSYPANSGNIEKQVEDYLAREAMRGQVRAADDISFVLTESSYKMWSSLDYCRVQKQIVCIYGDAGCGKTFTAREWMKEKTNIIFITASSAINSPKAVLKTFARALKTRTSGNKDDLYFEIIEKISGTDITFIIDEAQHFNYATIEMIRSIKDECNIGLALIGNATIYDKITGKQQAEFAQLFSRLMMRTHILTDQFTKDDVVKLFGAIKEEELDYLLLVCRSKYGLRGATFLYMNAANNENTTKNGLKAMARNMGILV